MAKAKTGVAAAAQAHPSSPNLTPVSDAAPSEGEEVGAEAVEEHEVGVLTPENATTHAGVARVVEEEVTTALTIPKATQIATLDDVQNIMLEDAEQDLGFEKGDVALPFMRILQSNSPQVKRQNAKYVDGAEAGDFYNTAMNSIQKGDKGIYVIPVHFTKQATLWVPRTPDGQNPQGPSGGGFVREIPVPEAQELLKRCTKNDKGKDITPSDYKDHQGVSNGGLELVIAALYYLLVFDPEAGDGTFDAVAYPLTSTQLKKARAWNAIIQNSRLPHPSGVGTYRAPMFGYAYKLTTVPESNAKGDWMGLKVAQWSALIKTKDGAPAEQFPGAAQLYLAARDFKNLVAQGHVTVKAETMVEDDGGSMGGVESGAGGGKNEDDDLPF